MAFKIKNNVLKFGIESDTPGELIIPEGVIEIAPGAFLNNCHIKHIIFPKTLVKIGERAFSGCKSLEKVELPANIKEVGDFCFSHCEQLKSFSCTPSETKFGNGVLYMCCALTTYMDAKDTATLFYLKRRHCFGVTKFVHTTKSGVKIYRGRISMANFPAGGVSDPSIIFFAVATDTNGRTYTWYSKDRQLAVAGAYMQANKVTLKDEFGDIDHKKTFSAKDVSLMCGFCPEGIDVWAKKRGTTTDTEYTVEEILSMLYNDLPGAYRRFVFVLHHWDEVLNVWDSEKEPMPEELVSKKKLPTEKDSAEE